MGKWHKQETINLEYYNYAQYSNLKFKAPFGNKKTQKWETIIL